jgi:hypothetical protein
MRYRNCWDAGRSTIVTAIVIMAMAITGCNVNAALERVSQARAISADLLVQFAKASDAGNRAVMADSDAMSSAFVREAEAATQAVLKDADALAPILQELKFTDESALLAEFRTRFQAYEEVDRNVLELALQQTNLKARKLSFGEAQQAADAFSRALQSVTSSESGERAWHVKALAATAVASVREIQALQAPHIAESQDVAMTGLEKRMASAESAARTALADLAHVIGPASRPRLAQANSALDRLTTLNAQIIELSRRNSNVRSLALSLNQKRTVTAPCEETLRALHDALAKRGFSGTR